MNRRDFLYQSTAVGAAISLSHLSCASMKSKFGPNYKMGYQLFSVNEDMKRAPKETILALQQMGYKDFEIYGFDPDAISYYGLPATELKSFLDDHRLSVTSGHYGFADYQDRSIDELRRYVDSCIRGAHSLQSPYITWPWVAPENRNIESYKRLCDKLNLIGEQVNAAGLGFAYHNHGYEFDTQDGTNCYEVILSETDPTLVKLQLDMYWVMHAGVTTPKELVKRQPGRIVMWHIKDMHKVSRDYTELGNGSIDYHTVLPDPQESGLEYYYIEQGGNFAVSAMQSAATSAQYLQKELITYL